MLLQECFDGVFLPPQDSLLGLELGVQTVGGRHRPSVIIVICSADARDIPTASFKARIALVGTKVMPPGISYERSCREDDDRPRPLDFATVVTSASGNVNLGRAQGRGRFAVAAFAFSLRPGAKAAGCDDPASGSPSFSSSSTSSLSSASAGLLP